MDNLRVFLWAGLAMMIWLSFTTWQRQFQTTPPTQSQSQQDAVEDVASSEPTAQLPSLPEMAAGSASESARAPALPDTVDETDNTRSIRVTTDVLDVEIDLTGGTLIAANLSKYPLQKDQPDIPVRLLSAATADYFDERSGIRAGDERPEANHRAVFSADRGSYELAAGADELDVTLTWIGTGGIETRKTYTFRRGSYAIELEQVVSNTGVEPYRAVSYLQIQRRHNPAC